MQQGKQYRSKSYGLAASAMELLLSGMGEEQLGKYSFLWDRKAAELKLQMKTIDRLYR